VQIPTCSHRPPCPGCPRYGAANIAPAARATLNALAHAHGLTEVPEVTGELQAFRHRARLAIRGRLGSPKLGLFELGTHRVVHIPNCIVHHPLINRVAAVVRRALVETRVPPYSDTAHLGLARYLQVVVERQSQTAQVVIVVNSAEQAMFAPCLDLIRERLGPELHSLWLNRQQQPTNTVLGPDFLRWCGPESVVEHFGEAAVHYPPGAFGQNNLEIGQAIIDHVRHHVPEGSRIAEFYAGVGAIGLSVLGRASAMTLNEISPQSLRGLELGLNDLQLADRSKVTVIPGPASAARSSASAAQVVIADPPRKGLEVELIDHLAAHPPERFIYISCGIDSFAADVAHLTAIGRLRLASLTAFNLTPFTEHVETVARLERV
jgi:23S rRNA (uracil1939-C5)-methyltransferase